MFPAIALSQLVKGRKVTVLLPNGKRRRLVAAVDSVDRYVIVANGKVFGNTSQMVSVRTNNIFRHSPGVVIEGVYPYFSLFIDNIEGQFVLMATYNNSLQYIGDLSFGEFASLNFQYLGDGQFKGTGLSIDETKFIEFDSSESTIIKPEIQIDFEIPPNTDFVESRGHAGSRYFTVYTLRDQMLFEPRNLSDDYEEFINRDGDNIGYEFSQNKSPVFFFGGTNHSYTEVRNSIEATPGGFVSHAHTIDFSHSGSVTVQTSPPVISANDSVVPFNDSGTVSHSYQETEVGVTDYTRDLAVDITDDSEYFAKRRETNQITIDNIINVTSNIIFSLENEGGVFANKIHRISTQGTKNYSIDQQKFEESIYPIIVNDFQIVDEVSIRSKDNNSESTLTVDYTNVNYNAIASNGGTFTFSNVVVDNNLTLTPRSILNLGRIGLFTLYTTATNNIFTDTRLVTGSVRARSDQIEGTPDHPNSAKGFRYHNIVTPFKAHGNGFSEFYTTSSSIVFDVLIQFNSYQGVEYERASFYHLAYLEEEPFIVKPGFASLCSVLASDKAKVADKLLNPTSSHTINVRFNLDASDGERILTETTGGHQRFVDSVVEVDEYYRQVVNPLDSRGLDLTTGDTAYFKTVIDGIIYLCKGEVTGTNTEQTDVPIDDQSRNTITIIDLDFRLDLVRTITSFAVLYEDLLSNNDFFYTEDGCDIFNYLNHNWLNLIEIENEGAPPDLYLAYSMPNPLSEEDTQTLIFQVNDDRISYLGITGGTITNIDSSVGAENYLKFYQFPFEFD